MQVGFIGLGKMGLGMARNIAAAGHDVLAWNRSPVDPVDAHGIVVVDAAADVFARADAVLTMLSDDAAIRSVVLDAGLLDGAREGLVHVVTATISIDFARELAAAHARAGVDYVSAPVFGRPDVAAAGKLNVVAGGAATAVAAVQPLFDAIGQRTFVMGEEPEKANAAKIAGNMMIAMAIEALAEGIAITEAQGVAPAVFVDLMTQTLFGGRAYEGYGAKIVAGDVEAGFRLALGLKDLRLATAAGEASGRSLPMLAAVHGRMAEADAAGRGDQDWSAMAAETLGR